MSEEAALLFAILLQPDDITKWLVYADWLEENAGRVVCGKCAGTGVVTTHWLIAEMDPTECCLLDTSGCGRCRGSGFLPNDKASRASQIRKVQQEMWEGKRRRYCWNTTNFKRQTSLVLSVGWEFPLLKEVVGVTFGPLVLSAGWASVRDGYWTLPGVFVDKIEPEYLMEGESNPTIRIEAEIADTPIFTAGG